MASYTIYFAGDLFDHKDLIGNALLAAAIERHSGGRYACVLPQHLEQATSRAVAIRNQDLRQVITCDMGLFNFDGPDLDSGTVVEFLMAKFLDIPSVILRSDFRSSGDQGKEGDDWNLMCSFYPRTRVVRFNAMAWYQEAQAAGGTLNDVSERLYARAARVLIEQLDAVRAEPTVLNREDAWVRQLYAWAVQFPGGGLASDCGPGFPERIVEAKRRKGMI
jgi:hypothetical protein